MSTANKRLSWLLAGALLAGCGLKGDLVLPERQAAPEAKAAEAAPAPPANAPSADEPDDDRR